MTTEIIFAGVLSDLTPEEAVALLSALVFQVPLVQLTVHSNAKGSGGVGGREYDVA